MRYYFAGDPQKAKANLNNHTEKIMEALLDVISVKLRDDYTVARLGAAKQS